jgi:hypothetical protein
MGSYGFYEYSTTGQTNYLYSNTIADCAAGIRRTSSGVTLKNNLVYSIATASSTYVGTFGATSDYNSTDANDDVGVGANERKSQTFTFVDSANDNFKLTTSDAGAYNLGMNLYNDANWPFQDDIVDTDRGGVGAVWSIGMFEPGATNPTIMRKYRHFLRR